ncbi:ABC transporter substrate-binding protein [Sedimentitalea sp. JM2-8]|uniref:ABC transporter substrate-binding protein n=1 Tax=Sedimentitalea xiamensis TaxID=3050037 RepID=A0ABT7FKZ7_9RHOB|nr:ABC transporter substrate-binding protein [Sedimentitalea xiamensis]MDK3075841.1 ABC transporter substrate-binding protein [Sedimentitalea xiamensis]
MTRMPFVRGIASAITLSLGAGSAAVAAQEMTQERIAAAITETIAGYNPYGDAVVLIGSLWCKVYGCLMRYDFETGRPIPYLAESVEPEDELNWIVRLRPDWVRHNGDPVLAEDVVHSIDRMRNDPESTSSFLVQPIASAEVVDDLTVRITTHEPTATLADNLTAVQITSKRLFDEHGQEVYRTHPHGAGPYRLAELSIGTHMVLERVDDHPMVSPSNPQQIMYRIMAEPEARVTALANNEVQIAQGVPPQLIDRVEQLPNARVEFANSVEMMFLAMNPSTHPWEVKEARQAVAHAINREAIVRALLGGRATLLNGPVGEGQFGFDPEFETPYDYDPDRARSLLESAGLLGVEIDFYTPVGRYTADRQIAEAMVPMLEEAGFTVSLRTPEWATLWSNVQAGGVPFYYMGRGQMLDPSRALRQYFETGGSPRLDFSDPDLDSLLQAERAAFDPDQRYDMMRAAIVRLTGEVPAHFLWLHQMAWGVSESIDYTPRQADRIDGWDIHVRAGN